jgi:hypothetical protein
MPRVCVDKQARTPAWQKNEWITGAGFDSLSPQALPCGKLKGNASVLKKSAPNPQIRGKDLGSAEA